MTMNNNDSKKLLSLSDADISADRSIDRRSAFRAIGAVVAGAAAAAVVAQTNEAEAQCTDSDGGRFADAPGRGRRCRRVYIRRRCTDSDAGYGADRPGRGRRC